MASASSLKRNSGATGPKVSSRATIVSVVTSARMVGSEEAAAQRVTLAADNHRAPLPIASAMCSSTFDRIHVDQRAWLVPGLEAVADLAWRPPRRASAKASYTPSCTSRRLGDAGLAAVAVLEASAPSTAASRSASSKTTKGALPPSPATAFDRRALRQFDADLGRAGEGQLAHDRLAVICRRSRRHCR